MRRGMCGVTFVFAVILCRGDGTFAPDPPDMPVAEAGQFHGAVLCEEYGFEPDIAVGGAVLVQER